MSLRAKIYFFFATSEIEYKVIAENPYMWKWYMILWDYEMITFVTVDGLFSIHIREIWSSWAKAWMKGISRVKNVKQDTVELAK